MKKLVLTFCVVACDSRTVNITAGKNGTNIEVTTDTKAVRDAEVSVRVIGVTEFRVIPTLPLPVKYCPTAEKAP